MMEQLLMKSSSKFAREQPEHNEIPNNHNKLIIHLQVLQYVST